MFAFDSEHRTTRIVLWTRILSYLFSVCFFAYSVGTRKPDITYSHRSMRCEAILGADDGAGGVLDSKIIIRDYYIIRHIYLLGLFVDCAVKSC